ncbi:MAG: efflux RND transporter periplasmic adaptor subunit [Phycisphaerae bacterium]|nr:efflux RND transporter periplasmic adaptor subunit [Gemmatimonadaceae bacterium]
MMNTRVFVAFVAVTVLAGCSKKKETVMQIGSSKIERRNITVDATATGAVEPISIVEVKSKAGGQITRMPVETGSQVRAGQLLVQIDTRDVQNSYEQAEADVRSAKAQLDVAEANKKRSDELFKTRIITTNEYESATLQLTQAQAGSVRANTNLDLAKQRLEEATVVAPLSGTVIERPVSEGMVISGATGNSATGGTTLLKMADLSKVQMRVLVNETDIGNIRSGLPTRVVVDAYPERSFAGVVEKIEPQAIVSQSVTMFPVIVSLRNDEGYLKPGMNGEVTVVIDQKMQVVAVPNDAVRTLREAATAAALVGLNADTVQAYVRAEQAKMASAGRGGAGGAGRPVDAASTTAVAAGADSGARSGNAAAGGRQGAGRDAGGTRVATSGGEGRRGGVAGRGGRGGRGGGTEGAARAGGNMSNAMTGGPRIAPRVRTGLVFVVNAAGGYEPRVLRLGASNYDYSEVLSGIEEGETVATLAVAALQAKRDAANDRMRAQQGGGVPGMSAGAPVGGGRGGPGGGGGGGGGGGRGGI